MSSQIQKVLKQALITFSSKPEAFASNLQLLSLILDKLSAEDVKLDIKKFENKEGAGEPSPAPVTYIDIYEDSSVTLGIFVVKQNKKLPLHNHPEMHGLLKVLSGKVKIISYSLNTPKTLEIDAQNWKDPQPHHFLRSKRTITAEMTGDEIIDSSSKPCLLEPTKKNIHEIHSIDGPAAFIDILAPPYMTKIANGGLRHCSYYSIASNLAPNVFKLQETRHPSWYWTDSVPYTGPDPRVDLQLDTQSN